MGNLDSWFNYQSKRLDEIENNYGKCLITGQKKKPTTLTKKQAWSKIFRRNKL